MVYHMGVLAIVAFITLFYATKGEEQITTKKYSVVACTIVLGLFLGLRTWWMSDLIKYHTQYLKCGSSSITQIAQEKLSNLGLRIFFHYEYLLTNGNYHIALFIISVFCVSCVGYIIYKYSSSPFWSYMMFICMGYYFFFFSGLKQSIAMAFLLLAFDGIIEEKPKYFVLMTCLAGLFHTPAFIFLPTYFIVKSKINRNYWFVIIGLFAGVFVLRGPIVSILSDLYYDEGVDTTAEGVGGKFLMMFAILIVGYFLRPLDDSDKLYSKVFNMMVISALLQSFSVFGHNFTRLADYYYQFVILFVPMIFEGKRSPDYKNAKYPGGSIVAMNTQLVSCMYVFVALFSLWYYYRYISTDVTGILDYKFFWQVDYLG